MVTRIAQGEMFDFTDQFKTLLQCSHLIKTIKEQQHASSREQFLEHLLVNLDSITLEEDLCHKCKEIIVCTLALLIEAAQFNAQRQGIAREQRHVSKGTSR